MTEKLIEHKPEKKEEYKYEDALVYRVRHGNTEYKEQMERIMNDEDIPDLTKEGISQIKDAGHAIVERLESEKENVIVWVIESPLKRTRDSAKIIRNILRNKGFFVWEDPKEREKQEKIRGSDVLNDQGEVISPGDEKYTQTVKKVIEEINVALEDPEIIKKAKEFLPNELKNEKLNIEQLFSLIDQPSQNIEKWSNVSSRARDQLSFLTNVVKTIQPKLDKRIVIVQTEHSETIDEMLEKASDGKDTMKRKTGAKNGEVFELKIPVEGEEIGVASITEDRNLHSVKFNRKNREFYDQEK